MMKQNTKDENRKTSANKLWGIKRPIFEELFKDKDKRDRNKSMGRGKSNQKVKVGREE